VPGPNACIKVTLVTEDSRSITWNCSLHSEELYIYYRGGFW